MKLGTFALVLFGLCCIIEGSASSASDAPSEVHLAARELLRGAPEASPSTTEDCEDDSSEGRGSCDRCQVEDGVWRPGNTYNDPSALKTANATVCCDQCQADSRCVAWSRDRLTMACALKDQISAGFGDSRYESSGGEGIETRLVPRRVETVITLPDGTNRTIADEVTASEIVPLEDCYVEAGVAYRGGTIFRRTTTESHIACCELYRDASECFSWYRNANNRRCILNRDVPRASRRGEHFAGAATI